MRLGKLLGNRRIEIARDLFVGNPINGAFGGWTFASELNRQST